MKISIYLNYFFKLLSSTQEGLKKTLILSCMRLRSNDLYVFTAKFNYVVLILLIARHGFVREGGKLCCERSKQKKNLELYPHIWHCGGS